jgi:hypothetical protein
MDTTSGGWNVRLDAMIDGMKLVIEDEQYPFDKEKINKVEKAMNLFRGFFFGLWS